MVFMFNVPDIVQDRLYVCVFFLGGGVGGWKKKNAPCYTRYTLQEFIF